MAGMNRETPPRWLERALFLLLEQRDRETISGDFLEEYREEKLPTLGRTRATYWYLRQVMSFGSIRVRRGGTVKQALMSVCFFTVAAGVWMTVMENILRHHGYGWRSAVAVCIAAQGAVTLLALLRSSGSLFRTVVMAGAAAIAALGITAVWGVAHAAHFEGFVAVIGAALLVQCVLTFATLLGARREVQPG